MEDRALLGSNPSAIAESEAGGKYLDIVLPFFRIHTCNGSVSIIGSVRYRKRPVILTSGQDRAPPPIPLPQIVRDKDATEWMPILANNVGEGGLARTPKVSRLRLQRRTHAFSRIKKIVHGVALRG